MEIRKEEAIRKINYPEKSFINLNVLKYPIFSAMLFSMLSNNSTYGVDVPPVDIAGGLTVINPYHKIISIGKSVVCIVTLISLITTIIYGVKLHGLKKNKDTIISGENVENTGEKMKKDVLKRAEKKFSISRIVFILTIMIYIVFQIVDIIFDL